MDVANLRLTSRAWAGVCVQGLFNASVGPCIQNGVFSIRPHLDDMTRIKEVSSRPWLAKHIKHLEIFVGDFNFEQYERSFELKEGETKQRVKDLLEKISQTSEAYCDPVLLHHAFSLFPNVDSLSATSTRCPFPESDLNLHMAWDSMVEAWDSSRSQNSFLDNKTSVNRYFAIFYAASRCFPSRIRTMVLDPMPIDLFFSPEEASKLARGDVGDDDEAQKFIVRGSKPRKHKAEILYTQVRDLRISLAGFCNPLYSRVPKLGQVLGQFLGYMRHLRSLDLSWEIENTSNNEFEARWQESFYQNVWPHLESLRIRNIKTPDDLLLSFISRHAPTLTRLSIIRCSLGYRPAEASLWNSEGGEAADQDGSVKKMLTRFKDELKLEKFQILFDLEDIKIYDEEWNAMPGHEDSNIDWKTTSSRPPENAKLLEMFTRGICSWPMADDRPQWDGCWRRLDGWKIGD